MRHRKMMETMKQPNDADRQEEMKPIKQTKQAITVVDIIIPVYNALEDLKRCVASVRKWTHPSAYRLVLINDNSPDERVRPYLDSLGQEHCIVIHNWENRGFPANVNIGMGQSRTNDVLLLNSDTAVTKGWLEKLRICAYSSHTIATVTPLSNHASLCSVPNFCSENKIPRGYTLDAYADLVERVSLRSYPDLPVANGFCMYIKREVIKQIGTFDAAAFARGYGEENDFCYRALEAGWRHVMCDDTFIFHAGTRSFSSEEKRKRIAQHEKILDQRYPKRMQDVRIHCRDNPNAWVSENIRMWVKLESRKKRGTVLYLAQADFRDDAADHVGGTQLHVKDLTAGLRKQYDIVVAAGNGSDLNVTLYMEKDEQTFRYYIGGKKDYETFRSERMAALYGKILDNFSIDAVHIHHTKGLTLELFYEAAKRDIPIFATIHDFYCLCPGVNLLNDNQQVCGTGRVPCNGKKAACPSGQPVERPREDLEYCRVCLHKQAGVAQTVPYLSIWREEHLRALRLAQRIFVPSESAARIVSGCFAELGGRIRVLEHGIGPFSHTRQGQAERTSLRQKPNQAAEAFLTPDAKQKKVFRVAFLGGINTAKGYRCAVDLIRKSSRDIHWYLFGKFEREDSSLERRDNFFNIGPYRREELPDLMKKHAVDLVCVLSIWPETFCYTISESLLSGVPVLVTDIGALGERVRAIECGWAVPVQADAEAILERIKQIRKNKADYTKKREQVRKQHLRTAAEMCGLYEAEYRKKMPALSKRQDKYDYEWMLAGAMKTIRDSGGGWDQNRELEMRLAQAEQKISVIEQSFTYRLLRMIAAVNLPFRASIRRFLRGVYHTAKTYREWTTAKQAGSRKDGG